MDTNLPGGDQQIIADSLAPATTSRIFSLDVLRGVAVSAALLVSIWVFGGFSEEQQKDFLLKPQTWNHKLFVTVDIFLNGKLRALIALVFGASMVLFLTRKTAPGGKPAGDVFINRNLLLILFGLVNSMLFLWTHDLLFHLGVMGVLLFPFVRLSNRAMFIVALVITLIACGKYYWNYSDDKKMYRKYLAVTALEKKFVRDSIAKAKTDKAVKKDTLTKFQKQEKSAWEGLVASKKVNLKKDEGNTKAMRDHSYGKTWNHVLPTTQYREAEWMYRTGIWDLGCMMFLGMLLYRIGFFTSRFSKTKYLLFGLVCLVGGILFAGFRLHHDVTALTDYEKYIKKYVLPYNFFFPLEKALLGLSYASFIMMLLPVRFLNGIWRAFAAVGKLALSNYLLQSILCTIFFYGYGMGYYGRLSQWELYVFALEVIVVQIALSVLWLRFYNYGPAEWLLRRLSSKRWVMYNKKSPEADSIIATIS